MHIMVIMGHYCQCWLIVPWLIASLSGYTLPLLISIGYVRLLGGGGAELVCYGIFSRCLDKEQCIPVYFIEQSQQ